MKKKRLPFVSICTPTFNRRPFIPYMLKCFEHQTYPKDKIEWIIIDDGTDPIGDLVNHIPQIKYFRYETKMTLGSKRNLAHAKSTGDILVYMDDDDYYPPERVSHAVEMLQQNPKALCAGSSEMHIYFKHISQMYKFGPYGPNHATAATFAFRRELLKQTCYEETAAVSEERHFLKDYTVPFVQLDTIKTILVFSHEHNSFDKKSLLANAPNKYVMPSTKTVDDFIKNHDLKVFYMDNVDAILKTYEPGSLSYKPDVVKQINEINLKREKMIQDHHHQQKIQNEVLQRLQAQNEIRPEQIIASYQAKMNEMNQIIQGLLNENASLKETNQYLNIKIKEIITNKIKTIKGLPTTEDSV
jgi:glycosyltransferase involved in cell wall biosynthesis